MDLLHFSGPLGLIEAALCPLGSVMLLVLCGLLISGRRVTPIITAAILAAPMGIGSLGVWMGEQMLFEVIAHASAETRQTLMAVGISQTLSLRLMSGGVVTILASITLLGCAVAGARGGPRGKGVPIAVVLLSLLISALVVTGGVLTDNLIGAMMRGGLYLLGGILTAAALLNTDKDSAGMQAGASAALALPMLVAGAEVFSMASAGRQAFEVVAYASAETKGPLLMQGLELVKQQEVLALAAVGFAVVVAIIGAVRTLEGSLRDVGIVCALAYCLLTPLWLSVDATLAFEALIQTFTALEQ